MMKNDAKKYIEQTKKALNISSKNKNRIALRGFDLTGIKSKKEECVLILGINPGGDAKDAKREYVSKEQYIYYIPTIHSSLGGWHYANYFGRLFNFIEGVFGKSKVKWPWCNCSENEFRELLNRRKELKGCEKELEEFYLQRKNSPITIYIGDMFYYHETNSKKLPYKVAMKDKMHDYYLDMIKMHVEELKHFNKDIKFIYINNAKVSHDLASDEDITHEKIKDIGGIEVFYGSILSGGRMDSFSKKRLINEIRSVIGIS